jgi:hypothetical protein
MDQTQHGIGPGERTQVIVSQLARLSGSLLDVFRERARTGRLESGLEA